MTVRVDSDALAILRAAASLQAESVEADTLQAVAIGRALLLTSPTTLQGLEAVKDADETPVDWDMLKNLTARVQ